MSTEAQAFGPLAGRNVQPQSQVACRYCGEVLTLNPDGEEARAKGEDPLQQMRKHVQTHGLLFVAQHARRCGFLIDMLAFDGVNRPGNYRKQLSEMVEFLLAEPVDKVPRPQAAKGSEGIV